MFNRRVLIEFFTGMLVGASLASILFLILGLILI